MYSSCMKRVNFHLTEKQKEGLDKESKRSGLSVAELIRRAVDNFLSSLSNKR